MSHSIEKNDFSPPTFNINRLDYGARYMHQGVLAGNYFLAILSSSKTDMKLLQQGIKHGRPLLESIVHDPNAQQEIRFFNLKTFRNVFIKPIYYILYMTIMLYDYILYSMHNVSKQLIKLGKHDEKYPISWTIHSSNKRFYRCRQKSNYI